MLPRVCKAALMIVVNSGGRSGMSVEDNLEPKLAWLQDQLSLDDESLGKWYWNLASALVNPKTPPLLAA